MYSVLLVELLVLALYFSGNIICELLQVRIYFALKYLVRQNTSAVEFIRMPRIYGPNESQVFGEKFLQKRERTRRKKNFPDREFNLKNAFALNLDPFNRNRSEAFMSKNCPEFSVGGLILPVTERRKSKFFVNPKKHLGVFFENPSMKRYE